jgi:hypothetical protein
VLSPKARVKSLFVIRRFKIKRFVMRFVIRRFVIRRFVIRRFAIRRFITRRFVMQKSKMMTIRKRRKEHIFRAIFNYLFSSPTTRHLSIVKTMRFSNQY